MHTLFAATWWFGRRAVEHAWQTWQESPLKDPAKRLLEAVVAGTAAVELDPEVLSVGYGGLPNQIGEVELDAAVMEGAQLRAGAVASVRRFVPAIRIAQRVMEKTPHQMLVGEGAERFAIQQGRKHPPLACVVSGAPCAAGGFEGTRWRITRYRWRAGLARGASGSCVFHQRAGREDARARGRLAHLRRGAVCR